MFNFRFVIFLLGCVCFGGCATVKVVPTDFSEIKTGTIVECRTSMDAASDSMGIFLAHVSRSIVARDGRVIIPKGTPVVLQFDRFENKVFSFRIPVLFQFPNGNLSLKALVLENPPKNGADIAIGLLGETTDEVTYFIRRDREFAVQIIQNCSAYNFIETQLK